VVPSAKARSAPKCRLDDAPKKPISLTSQTLVLLLEAAQSPSPAEVVGRSYAQNSLEHHRHCEKGEPAQYRLHENLWLREVDQLQLRMAHTHRQDLAHTEDLRSKYHHCPRKRLTTRRTSLLRPSNARNLCRPSWKFWKTSQRSPLRSCHHRSANHWKQYTIMFHIDQRLLLRRKCRHYLTQQLRTAHERRKDRLML
jgi:hypothetical protein